MAKINLRKSDSLQSARKIALDLRARRLDELVVLHAGWARRHARHAAQAVVHVLPKTGIERGLTFSGLLDHVDSSARRIHLLAPQHVRGASGQAEAAMHAVVDVLLLRRMVGVEAGRMRFFAGTVVCGIDVKYSPQNGRG